MKKQFSWRSVREEEHERETEANEHFRVLMEGIETVMMANGAGYCERAGKSGGE